jgi:hypothetical protein
VSKRQPKSERKSAKPTAAPSIVHQPKLRAEQSDAASIAFEMEADLRDIGNLARAIFCIAEGLSIKEGLREPIETVAMLIVDRVKVLEQQRARAAGQGDGT